MDAEPAEANSDDSPESALQAIRAHSDWTPARRDEALDSLVRRFPLARLESAVRGRLADLSGPDAEALLRLVEAIGSDELFGALAESVAAQPDLPPERAWEALSVLDGAGLVEDDPELAARWDELRELVEADDAAGSIEQLAEQIEDDADETWVALHGLGAVEPEVRSEIVAGLVGVTPGPGLVEFLRLLAFAHDTETSAAALEVLEAHDGPGLVAAWAAIAADHPSAESRALALARLGAGAEDALADHRARPAPTIVRSLVTEVDGRGRGHVVLVAEEPGRRSTVAFLCDVRRGLPEVLGQVEPPGEAALGDAFFAEFAAGPDRDAVEGCHDLALALLAGCLRLCGPDTTPALRFWLERTVGPSLRPGPFPGAFGDWEPSTVPQEERAGRASDVLEACRAWADDSPLTFELAEEIADRSGPPDPERDAGAYRYLFEHRLRGRLELYRRMLYWMAAFWHAAGAVELGRSALAMAYELSDPQHAVPGNPFVAALTTLSLRAAQARLREGDDPRRTT